MQEKSLSRLLIFLLIGLALAYAFQISVGARSFTFTDFGGFYQSAHFGLEGKSPYSNTYIVPKIAEKNSSKPATATQGARPLNPPFFEMLILPLGYFSYAAGLWIWSCLSILCGVISIFILQKILPINRSPPINLTLGLILALFVYFPSFATIQFGQVSLLLLPLLMGAWLAARQEKSRRLGLLLGIAVSLKFFFGLFLFYFILRKEWTALRWFCLTFVICSLLPILFFGIKPYFQYHQILQHVNWYSSSWNASLYGFLLRLFGGSEHNVALFTLPQLTPILLWFLSGLVMIGFLVTLWPSAKISVQKKTDIDFSITLVALLLLSPLAWLYYFVFLVIPCLVLLQSAEEYGQERIKLLTCLAIILSGLSHTLVSQKAIIHSNVLQVFFFSSIYVTILVLSFGLLIFLRLNIQHMGSNRTDLSIDSLPLSTYIIALLPSLFGILGIINKAVLYGVTLLPNVSYVYFDS